MRWIWIDQILEIEKATRCVAIKNVSLAEDVVHDHFPATADRPATPVMPNPLIVEGMAQTAGILVGHARDFKEKVILAKVGKAEFRAAAAPGDQLRYTATIQNLHDNGASTHGVVEVTRPKSPQPIELATIDLMFSHIDQNVRGLKFPEHNFVVTDQFMSLLERCGVDTRPA